MVLQVTVNKSPTPESNTNPTGNSFVQRLIDVSFTLAKGTFTESGKDTVELKGLRISARIIKAGGRSFSTAHLQVYGMTLSLMNQLSTLGSSPMAFDKNQVSVSAGDANSGMSTVFIGTIIQAYAEFSDMPNVPFHVIANVGRNAALVPIPPASFQGSVDVATILSGLATQIGWAFENNGVSVQLSNPYFPGTAREQALAAVKEAGIEWNAGDNGTLAIWPKGSSRGGAIPLISPDTGMIAYPSYTNAGIVIKTLFNPNVGLGGKIKVQSSLTPASGIWAVQNISYDLDALMPGGQWSCTIIATQPGLVRVAP